MVMDANVAGRYLGERRNHGSGQQKKRGRKKPETQSARK